MKKTIVFIFLLFSISAFSQQNKWNVGIVGGPSITALRMVNSKLEPPTPTAGFYFGISGRYNFTKNFSIHTELAFDRKGAVNNTTFTDASGNVLSTSKLATQFNYLTLPLLLRASVGSKVEYFLQAGPCVSYLLNQTYKYSNTSVDQNAVHKSNGTMFRPDIDFGISAGLGIVVPVKEKITISFELRENYGLIDLTKNNSNSNIKSYNESLSFLVGIVYKLGK